MMPEYSPLTVYLGEDLARYHFGAQHPFGPDRHDAFKRAFDAQGLDDQARILAPVTADEDLIGRFHTQGYIEQVRSQSATGSGYLDSGDTPAVKGIYEAAATVVGTTVEALERIMRGEGPRAFIPIAGLHHAARSRAAGFCVFNDCGVAIETLLQQHGLDRLAYVDIDAHHGDGVYYGFEANPAVICADLHQDGRTLYPGSGDTGEQGTGEAKGTKLNIPMPPGADDKLFHDVWPRIESHITAYPPDFIFLQCGADSVAGDPLTAMAYTSAAHAHAAYRLRTLADRYCQGRLLAMGGGGYDLGNIASAWGAVAEALI